MAGLERDEAAVPVLWMQFAEGREEFVRETFIEGELWWKLYEQRAEFVAEPSDLLDEFVQHCSAVGELSGVRDGLWNLYGETEIGWGAGCPTLPGFQLVWTMEARINFDAVETVRAPLEVRAFCRKVLSVLLWQRPPCSADADGIRC